jgi:transposase
MPGRWKTKRIIRQPRTTSQYWVEVPGAHTAQNVLANPANELRIIQYHRHHMAGETVKIHVDGCRLCFPVTAQSHGNQSNRMRVSRPDNMNRIRWIPKLPSLSTLTRTQMLVPLEQLHQFASQFASRRWAIEGAGNRFVAQFVNELLAKGEAIYAIAPSLTSQYRSRRGTKKNDQVDAANVARALLANPQLPSLRYSDRQRELQELSRAQRRLAEQLRSNRAALAELSEHSPVRAVLDEVIRTLIVQLKELAKRLRSIVRTVMPTLLELSGVGAIVAGTLLAEVGDPQRFPTADHFASYCGAAHVERGSGQNSRMQVNPRGNRRLNWALHIIALVRLRMDGGRSRQFMAKQTDHGKAKRAALRLMKTYIAREVFKTIRQSYCGPGPSAA